MAAGALPAGVIILDVDPTIQLGPLEVAWHGLMTAVGILVAAAIATRYARRRGLDPEPLQVTILWTAVAGMIGARIVYLLENDAAALLDPSAWLGSRGFSFYGGMIFGGATAAVLLRRQGLGLRHLDALAAGFPLGMAVGRIGDLINGEHYGAASDLPWAIRYAHPAAETPSSAVAYHAGGLYEIALALTIAALVWALRDRLRRPGQLFWTVIGLYAAGRFAMFFYRVDSEPLALGLDTSQWISLAIALVAAVGLLLASEPALRRQRAATAATVALVGAAFFLVTGCFDSTEEATPVTAAPGEPVVEDPGPVHIHGLDIDPADGALYIATHTGLFRLPKGDEEAERVADRYQDTMAFSIVGPRRFLASGHPDGREGLPPFLGLIESRDAGENWKPISLQGKVDFHLLAAEGKRIYGYGSRWQGDDAVLLASDDSGRAWQRRPIPAPLVSLATSPADARQLIASDAHGLHLSRNGGRSWRALRSSAGLVAWPRSDRLYVADSDGVVSLSTDRGRQWQAVGQLPDGPVAFDYTGGRLYAALHQGTILVSANGGSTWRVRSEP